MFEFNVKTEGKNELGLVELLKEFADGFWTPDHAAEDQARDMILREFKRKIETEFKLLDLQMKT